MKYKDFEEKISSMQDKIGDDSSNLILDDVAVLLTDNQKMNQEIDSKEEKIKTLENSIEKLQKVNANLLMQLPVMKEEHKEEVKEKKEYHSMREAFDEFGNFKM